MENNYASMNGDSDFDLLKMEEETRNMQANLNHDLIGQFSNTNIFKDSSGSLLKGSRIKNQQAIGFNTDLSGQMSQTQHYYDDSLHNSTAQNSKDQYRQYGQEDLNGKNVNISNDHSNHDFKYDTQNQQYNVQQHPQYSSSQYDYYQENIQQLQDNQMNNNYEFNYQNNGKTKSINSNNKFGIHLENELASSNNHRFSLQSNSTFSETETQRKNRHTVENVRQRIQQEHEQACTFKPNINKNFRSLKQKAIGKERLKLLSQPKDISNLENQRKELEKTEMQECTFKPNISSKSSKQFKNHEELIERLSHSHDNRISQREMQKRLEELELVQKYKFKPNIDNDSKKYIDEENYRPVYERVGELQRQKYEMLHSLRMKTEEEMKNEYTFKPQVSEKSEEIAKETVKRLSFQDRFVHPQSIERMRPHSAISNEKENFTFHPTVNKLSVKILESRELYGQNSDFLKRQEILSIQSQQKQSQLKKKINQKYNFKPKVSKTSQMLIDTHPDVGSETLDDKIERLVYKDKQRIDTLKEKIQESHYNQFDFKPKINAISKEMARSLTYEEMANNEHNLRIKEMAKNRIEKQEREIYTFTPKLINPELTKKLANKSKFRNTEEILQDKQRKIEEYIRMQQYKEVKDCTFEPKINKSALIQTGPVIINGLGKHLQRVERAKQIKEDQDQREQEVFHVKLNDYQRQLPYTVPEPFNLHHNAIDVEENRRRVRQKWVQHELSDCTFKPQTNTSLVDLLVYDDL